MGVSAFLGSSALLPAGLGFRNAIINGDFRINQRGFTSSTTNNSYGFDRWLPVNSGGTVTYSAQTFSLGNGISGYEPINYARLATTGQSTTGDLAILCQKIESVRTFAGQRVTVSFWARASSGTPKVAVELFQAFGSGGSPSSSVSNYAGQATLSTSWVRYTFSVNVASISGKTVGTTHDGALELNLWTSAGSAYDNRTGSLGIQNSTIDFWGIQVEQNSQATPFEQRPIGTELALCQRYYEDSVQRVAMVGGALGLGGNTYFSSIFFKVTKRIAPTSLGGSSDTPGVIRVWDNNGTAGAVSLYNAGWTNGVTTAGYESFSVNHFSPYTFGSITDAKYGALRWAMSAEL